MLPNIITKTQLTAFLRSGPKVINSSHPNFEMIKNKILNDAFDENVPADVNLFDLVPKGRLGDNLGKYHGKFDIDRKGVFFRGERVHNTVCDRIVENLIAGYPVDSLINFLGKLLQNPFPDVVKNLYTYLEKYNLAIDYDGNIIGIKSINPNYTSIYKPSFQYPTKGVVSEPIHLLQKDPNAPCGPGLYFGFEDFVFGWGRSNSIVIIVSVNPADIIGIPADSGYQKMRAHTLEVIKTLGKVEDLKGKFKVISNIAEKSFPEVANKPEAKIKPIYHKTSYRNSKGQFISAVGAKRDKFGRFISK